MALTNRFLLPYGNDAVAAMGIVVKANLIAVLVLVGLAFGVQPLIGYNYGAKNSKRLKDILKFSYGFECGTAAVLALLLSAAAPALIRIFMQDPGIIDLGVPMLRFQQAGMIFIAVVLVTTSTFQSAGKALGALPPVCEQTGCDLRYCDLPGFKNFWLLWRSGFPGGFRLFHSYSGGSASAPLDT